MTGLSLVEAWLSNLRHVLSDDSLVATEVRVGVFYTAARLGSGQVGVAFTPRNLTDTVCCPRSAAAAPPAGQMAGQDAWTLAQFALSDVPLRRAVGVAVLNALSTLATELHGTPGGKLLLGMDALEAAGVRAEDRVALVGAFIPFIKTLKGHVDQLWIIDKHRDALNKDELSFWRPTEQVFETLSKASVVIITGSALVEGGIDSLLEAANQARMVVLAGPTAPPWHPPFFERGIHVLGGIRVLDAAKMLQVVSEGGSGHFFETAAEKICMIRDASETPPSKNNHHLR